MQLIADILLAAGAFGAAVYCYILAQRLKRLQTLETGMGGAIAVLSAQVDDMTKALENSRNAADNQVHTLEAITERGETVATRLELLLASMHDLPAEPQSSTTQARASAEPEEETGKRLRFVRRRPAQDPLEAVE